MTYRHLITKDKYIAALKERKLTQKLLSEELGENEKSFSRWINEGYPASKVRKLARALGLNKGDDFAELIGAPVFQTYFRKKYLGAPGEAAISRAITLAKFWLNTFESGLSGEGINLDMSNEIDHLKVAHVIRRNFQFQNGNFSFEDLKAKLLAEGVLVVPLSFEYFGIVEAANKSDNKEQAVTIWDGKKRFVILLDSDVEHAALIFNLFHELSHVFRPHAQQGREEESFCNKVASELMYPNLILSEIFNSNSDLAIKNKIKLVHERLGGSIFGIVTSISNRAMVVRNSPEYRVMWRLANSMKIAPRKNCPEQKTIDSVLEFYKKLDSSEALSEPWSKFKFSLVSGDLSGRKFAEFLNMESSDGIAIADVFMAEAEN